MLKRPSETPETWRQAGITGAELERKLHREGFTCGHEPDSQEFSTLGGWISTNASGMKRNRYGAIEDIVEQIFMVTPNGGFETMDKFPRQSAGIQVKSFLFGSEGNFGLITKAVIGIRELPEASSTNRSSSRTSSVVWNFCER